jgi:hypothetical protein
LGTLNETIRYNQRRRDKGKEIRHGKQLQQIREDSVDLLRWLDETNRRAMIENLLSTFGIACLKDTLLMIETDIQQCESYFESECEKVLGVIGVTATHVLILCNKHVLQQEVELISSRPWLRHLFWPACLAYILWDIL